MDKNKIVVLEDQLVRQNRELLLAYKKIKDNDIEIDRLRSQYGIITPADVSGTILLLFHYTVETNTVVNY